MSSYFGAGHEWQSTELPLNHFTAGKVCTNPYNSSLTDSRALTNGYQTYHSAHQTAYVMTPTPSVQRYVSSGGVEHSHGMGHNRFIESSLSFPHHSQHPSHSHHMSPHSHHSLQHHSHPHHSHAHHPHPDHVFTGGALLSGPTGAAPIQASVPYHSLSQHSSPTGVHSLPLSGHSVTNLLQTDPVLQEANVGRVVTPDQVCGTPHNTGSVSHPHQIYSSNQSPASCKLSANQFENNSLLTTTTRSASTTDESPAFDSSPPTTPEMAVINNQLTPQQNQNNKQFFPWMKSYTGQLCFHLCFHLFHTRIIVN